MTRPCYNKPWPFAGFAVDPNIPNPPHLYQSTTWCYWKMRTLMAKLELCSWCQP